MYCTVVRCRCIGCICRRKGQSGRAYKLPSSDSLWETIPVAGRTIRPRYLTWWLWIPVPMPADLRYYFNASYFSVTFRLYGQKPNYSISEKLPIH